MLPTKIKTHNMNYQEYDKRDLYHSERDGDYSYSEFSEFITLLIERDILDNEIEIGIVKLVDSKGTKILSEKQSKVLAKIVSRYESRECKLCGESIPLNEILDFEYNEGFCSYHKSIMDKNQD
jgi:hypothetical protein